MSSQLLLTPTYNIGTLEPSECHLAGGWGPTKREDDVGYCIIDET